MADKVDIFLGRKEDYNSAEPWGKFVWGRSYACGAVYQKKVIFNQDRSSVVDSLRDSASDICGHLCRHKYPEYELKNGFLVIEGEEENKKGEKRKKDRKEGKFKVVPCQPLSPEEEKIFRETLEGRLKEK